VTFNPATLPAGFIFTHSQVPPETTDSDVINFGSGNSNCFYVPPFEDYLKADAGIYFTKCIGK
jgi:hypothetical protein